VTWVRRYVAGSRPARQLAPEDLRRRPVTWTIGGLTPAAAFLGNVVAAHAAVIQVGLLMCKLVHGLRIGMLPAAGGAGIVCKYA